MLEKKQHYTYYILIYRTRAIIARSRFETALDYKPRIFKVKKNFIVLQTSLQYKPRFVKLSKIVLIDSNCSGL